MAKRKPEEDEMELDNEFNNENFAPKAKFARYDEAKPVTLEDYGITCKVKHSVTPNWWGSFMVEEYYNYQFEKCNWLLHIQAAISYNSEKTNFKVNLFKFSLEIPMVVNNELIYKEVDTTESFEFINLADAPSFVTTNPQLKDFVKKTLSKEV